MNNDKNTNENHQENEQIMDRKASSSILSNRSIISLLAWSLRAFLFSIFILTLTAEVVLCKSCCSNPSIPTASTFATKQATKNNNEPTFEPNDSNYNQKDQTETNTVKNEIEPSNNEYGFLNDIVSNLTLAVNSVNNVLTGGSIALGILTLFIGIVGLFGFHSLKNDFNESKASIEKYKNDVNDILSDHEKQICQMTQIKESISIHNKTLGHYNNALYRIAVEIANANKPNESNKPNEPNESDGLLEIVTHNYQIAQLYSCLNREDFSSLDNTFAPFSYFIERGTMEDITHLTYIAKHHPNDRIRDEALEIIGRIKQRNKES